MKKFKSPAHKLIAFFEKSRDRWKKRSEGYKAKLESIRSKVRSLERSRDNWKEKYQQLAGQLSLEKTALCSTGTQADGSPACAAISLDKAKEWSQPEGQKKQLILDRED